MEASKTTRQRSPNYPSYGLRECHTFITKFYDKYGGREAHIDDAIKQMGHSPTSSTAPRVLATLSSFGLIDSRGSKTSRFVKLSRLGLEILMENEGTSKWYELWRQAALTDAGLSVIWNKWGATLPNVEKIRRSLVLEMGYSSDGAKRFANVIVDTYEFAHLSAQDQEELNKEESMEEEIQSLPVLGNSGTLALTMRQINLPLPGKDRQIVLSSPSDLTEEEFNHIIKWLELVKFGLVQTPKVDNSHP